MINRRELLRDGLAVFPIYALLAELGTAGAASGHGLSPKRWINRQNDIARTLARGEIDADQWRVEVVALAHDIDLSQLMKEIDQSIIKIIGRGLPNYPLKRAVYFRDDDGNRRILRYAAALFAFDRDNVITPHAHRHMVSAHMVIDGTFRVRNFDRVRDEEDAIVIRPTIDEDIRVGDVSSITICADTI